MSIKLSEYDVLKAVKERKITLTEAIAIDGFKSQPAYKFKSVREYLTPLLDAFSTHLAEERFVTAQSDWYLMRGEEFFGPLTIESILRLRKIRALHDSDVCFSMSLEAKLDPFLLETNEDAPEAKTTHYLRRRFQRQNLERIATIKRNGEDLHGVALDISIGGVGLYVKAALQAGDYVEVEIEPKNSMPRFFAKAIVESVQTKNFGHRCGLRFTNLEREEFTALEHFINNVAMSGT